MEKSKLYKLLGIIAATIVVIVLIIVLVVVLTNSGASYNYVETTIKTATEKYYNDHPDLLPSSGQTATVGADTLSAEGYMEPMEKLIKKDECTGTGKVFNSGLNNYYYSSSLTCGDKYTSTSAIDYLKSKQEIKTDGSGLYEETLSYPIIDETGKESDYVYNSTIGTTTRWVYRGKNPSNIMEIGKDSYYILSFSDQDIRLIKNYAYYSPFDDRYNEVSDNYAGKNIYNTSVIINAAEEVYDYLPADATNLVIPQNVCIGDRAASDLSRDGSSECKKVLVNQKYSLLTAYEAILPSTDENCPTNIKSCGNNNYLAESLTSWTTTPEAGTTSSAFVFNREGLMSQEVKWSNNFEIVITISPYVKISGEGTILNPFVLEG